jgi:hypothetical protein
MPRGKTQVDTIEGETQGIPGNQKSLSNKDRTTLALAITALKRPDWLSDQPAETAGTVILITPQALSPDTSGMAINCY